MNERLMRVAPASFAKFVTAFEEEKVGPKPGTQQTRQENLLWLVRGPAAGCCWKDPPAMTERRQELP